MILSWLLSSGVKSMRAVDAKAVRMVLEHRVTVVWEAPDGLSARGTVDGDHDTYQASFDPLGRICTCPAGSNHRGCSHAVALELEVARSREGLTV